MPYVPTQYEPVVPAAVDTGTVDSTTVLVVGAGPIGLACALDLGLRGHSIVLLSQNSRLTDGSRALCYARRPLEILDRLGLGERMVEKGVSWNIGRVFFRDKTDPVYSFDLSPVKDQKLPGMINIQQYYNEEYNIEALEALDNVDIRWGNKLTSLEEADDGIVATIETAKGDYEIQADWLIACDGSSSSIRNMLGLNFDGETFHDNFLIADVKFKKEYPTERHFWFDPPFNPAQSVLLHKQPDDVWRIDFQVGWDIDRDEIVKPENVTLRIQAMFGDDVEFEFEWISLYTFNCRQVDRMVQGRVVLAGDAAHIVSPFGARGANTGFQDTDNLAWKLDLIINGQANGSLLKSYDEERSPAARINILNSTRSTDFITPKSKISRQFRDAVLQLSSTHEFARGFVNSGRLSLPVPYLDSPLNSPDTDEWTGGVAPGTNCTDAPVMCGNKRSWLLNHLGWEFKVLIFSGAGQFTVEQQQELKSLANDDIPVSCIFVSEDALAGETVLTDVQGLAAERYGIGAGGGVYLIRPDQHVAARWRELDSGKIRDAVQRATGN
ncbi:MAG: FAD-dependent oxidoreductase [Gammaproteobacteria bacterium]|nr:FAD-dependent oxidoreductase [Gammaproteobacteria bacterium]